MLKFWGEKIASLTPSVGSVGYVRRLEKFERPISRITQALQTHSYREQARESHDAHVASQATARTTLPAELSHSTAAGYTLAGPLPGSAGAGAGPAAGGRRLVVLRDEKHQQKDDFWWTKGQQAAIRVKDELTDSLRQRYGRWQWGVSRAGRSRVPLRAYPWTTNLREAGAWLNTEMEGAPWHPLPHRFPCRSACWTSPRTGLTLWRAVSARRPKRFTLRRAVSPRQPKRSTMRLTHGAANIVVRIPAENSQGRPRRIGHMAWPIRLTAGSKGGGDADCQPYLVAPRHQVPGVGVGGCN